LPSPTRKSFKLHLQLSWLLRLELDRAKMIDRKLTMQCMVGRIAERVLCHNHRLVVPRHLLGRLHTQHLRFTIAQEDRLLQHILQRLLHSTLHLQDTLLLAHDTHPLRLPFHPRHLGIALSRLLSARHLHVILRQVHPSAPLLLDTLQLHLPTTCHHHRQNTLLHRRWHRRPRQNIPLRLLHIHPHHQHTHPHRPLTVQPRLLGRPPALLKIGTELRGVTLINPVRRGSRKCISGPCLHSFQTPFLLCPVSSTCIII